MHRCIPVEACRLQHNCHLVIMPSCMASTIALIKNERSLLASHQQSLQLYRVTPGTEEAWASWTRTVS